MFRHYLKVAFRSLWNEKVYLLINIVGLTVAIACCFLFIFWIRFETGFETCYPDADRIYQVMEAEERADGIQRHTKIQPAVPADLKRDYPFVEEAVYVINDNMPLTAENGERRLLDQVQSTPAFLRLFPMRCVAGTTAGVESKEESVFISEQLARSCFGTPEEAVGKTFTLFPETDFATIYTVDGVLAIPPNTHIRFDMLMLSESTVPFENLYSGGYYILFKKGQQPDASGHFLTERQQQHFAQLFRRGEADNITYNFRPIREMHLHTDSRTERIEYGSIYYNDIRQIRLFALVVCLVLLLAIINYVNTSTGKAISRMKEVGVRKVLGSDRRQLIVRFLTESFIISFIAVVLAVDVAKFCQPLFSEATGHWFAYRFDGATVLAAAIVCIVTTLLAGGYAAFYLSAFSPMQVLKGISPTGSKNYLRQVLVVIQLTLSIAILTSTFVVYRQLDYIFHKDLGFNRDDVYVLNTDIWYESEPFVQELEKNAQIVSASMASGAPFNATYSYTGIEWTGSSEAVRETEFANIYCDYRFADVFDLQMVKGTFLQPGYTWMDWLSAREKANNIVVNEAFEKLLRMENVIGTTITYFSPARQHKVSGRIVGVVKDFNFRPLQSEITPLIISYIPNGCNSMYIKLRPEYGKETLKYIETAYREAASADVFAKGRPFLLSSLDTAYDELYVNEVRLGRFLILFSILSIALSCMGIFGMTLFMVEKRTKEVALRKINGATTGDILLMFSKEFALLIAFASLIALPVTWLLMHRWMEQYAYHTSMGWWLFLLVPALILIITLATIILEIARAARHNPVDALRSE